MPHEAAATCPVRKLAPEERSGPAVERVVDAAGERWVVRAFDTAREVLRSTDAVRQAGFAAEQAARPGAKSRPPILYLEGAAHREQRSAAARLFAPKVVEGYRDMMETLSAELVAGLRPDRPVDLSRLSLRMAVQVAAQVVGLTDSSLTGMTRRLDAFFRGDPTGAPRSPRAIIRALSASTALLRFHRLDVRPAIRSRRRRRRDDVISQLLDRGYSDLDILTECVTYAAAGMVTTREFITLAAWHLLDHPPLLARYRAAEAEERVEILNEVLRLEPVVGNLYRRTTTPLTLHTADGVVEVEAGALIDLDLRCVNADPTTVSPEPLQLRPARSLPRAVPPSVMAFGDGNHRCPGASIALQESEVLLTELFRHDITADGPPRVRWNAVTKGYELDRFWIRIAG